MIFSWSYYSECAHIRKNARHNKINYVDGVDDYDDDDNDDGKNVSDSDDTQCQNKMLKNKH